MLALAGILLAVMAAGSAALVVFGLAAFVDRRWRDGMIRFAAGSASMIVMGVALAWTARSLLSADAWTNDVAPEAKARFLADGISGLMNVAVLGLPAGAIGGALLVWRRRLRARARVAPPPP